MQPYETLEHSWANFNKVMPSNMVACSSGTAALHLALESLKLTHKSQIVIPDYTMIACPRAASLARLHPVLLGCTPSLLMDLDALDDALCNCTNYSSRHSASAIMVVHVYGRVVNMAEVHALAAKYGVKVIEDMAEAHGTKPHPKTHAVCWSFYKNKIVAGEEGGAVYFKEEEQANLARELRCIGFTKDHNYLHTPRGHNYRLANLLATPILESIEDYHTNLAERRYLEAAYDYRCPEHYQMPPRDCPWVYDVKLPITNPLLQSRIVQRLNYLGIAARYGFKPMRDQEEYKGSPYFGNHLSKRYATQMIYLPLTPGQVTDHQIDQTFKVLREECGGG